MLIEKLSIGVLRVVTPSGTRYVRPAFARRVYLLWLFRHFDALPLKVLSQRQQRLVDKLCADSRFVPTPNPYGGDTPILGTVDALPEIEDENIRVKIPIAVVRAAVARLASAVQHRS